MNLFKISRFYLITYDHCQCWPVLTMTNIYCSYSIWRLYNGTYHMMRQSFGSTGRYINKMQLISQWDVVPNERLSLTSCTCICLSHRHFSRTQYAKLVCSILTAKWESMRHISIRYRKMLKIFWWRGKLAYTDNFFNQSHKIIFSKYS